MLRLSIAPVVLAAQTDCNQRIVVYSPRIVAVLIGVVRAAPTLMLLLPDPLTINHEETMLANRLLENKRSLENVPVI